MKLWQYGKKQEDCFIFKRCLKMKRLYLNKMTSSQLLKLISECEPLKNELYERCVQDAEFLLDNEYLIGVPNNAEYNIGLWGYTYFNLNVDYYDGESIRATIKYLDRLQNSYDFFYKQEIELNRFKTLLWRFYDVYDELNANNENKLINRLEELESILNDHIDEYLNGLYDINDSYMLDIFDFMICYGEKYSNAFIINGDYSQIYEHINAHYTPAQDVKIA